MSTLLGSYGESISLGSKGSDYINDTKTHHAGSGTDDANNTYHPDVDFWVVIKDLDGTSAFDSGSEAIDGDDPQAGEAVGDYWVEGLLDKIQLQSGAVRAVRG
jgi:hypothetical protein